MRFFTLILMLFISAEIFGQDPQPDKPVKHVLDFGYLGEMYNAPVGFIANYSLQRISKVDFHLNAGFKYWSNLQENRGYEISLNKGLLFKGRFLPDNLHLANTNIDYAEAGIFFNQYRVLLSNEWRDHSFNYGASYSEYLDNEHSHFSFLAGLSLRTPYYGLFRDAALNATIQYNPDRLYYDFGVYKTIYIKENTSLTAFVKYFDYEEINGLLVSIRVSIFNTRYYCCQSWLPYYHNVNVLK